MWCSKPSFTNHYIRPFKGIVGFKHYQLKQLLIASRTLQKIFSTSKLKTESPCLFFIFHLLSHKDDLLTLNFSQKLSLKREMIPKTLPVLGR